MQPLITDPIDLPPALCGAYGRAWTLEVAPGRDYGAVAGWLVEAPWSHAVVHSYWVSLIHLRPIEGLEVISYLADATHELAVAALNPRPEGVTRQQMIETGEILRHALRPYNFAAQIIAASDAEATRRVEAAVQQICDGRLSPDGDFRAQWAMRFGDNLMLDRAR